MSKEVKYTCDLCETIWHSPRDVVGIGSGRVLQFRRTEEATKHVCCRCLDRLVEVRKNLDKAKESGVINVGGF